MVHKINTAILTRFLFINDNTKEIQTGKIVTYEIRKPNNSIFDSGNMSEIGSTGLYEKSWTPNSAGWWIFKISCASPVTNDLHGYFVESGIEKDIKDYLENATYGLSAIENLIDDLESRLTSTRAGYLDNLSGGAIALDATVAKEATLDDIKGAGFATAADSLKKIRDKIDTLNDIAQSDILSDGTPFAGADIATIKGYVDEIESLLKNATYGLSVLEALVDEIESLLKDATYGLAKLARTGADGDTLESLSDQLDTIAGYTDEVESKINALENKIKASPSVDSILFKSGGVTCPTGKSIWNALGDATVSLNTLNNLLTHGTYGLSAIETLVDEVESLLKDVTYGLSALNDDLDILLTRIPSEVAQKSHLVHGTGTITPPDNKGIWDYLTNLDKAISTLNDLAQSDILNDATPFAGADIGTIKSEIQNATYGLSALEALVDEIESLLKDGTYGLSAIKALVDDLESRLTAARAGYLDELDFALQEYLESMKQKATDPSYNQDTDSLEAIREAIDALNNLSASEAADQVWDELTSGHTSVGSFGKEIQDIKTEADKIQSIKDKTDNLPASPASSGEYDTQLDQNLSTTESNIRGGTETLESLKDLINALNDLSAAEVDEALQNIHLDHLIQTSGILVGTPTSNFFATNLNETTDDHYNGLIIIFTSGNLAGQASIIADYDGSTKKITVDPEFIESPSSSDAFVILSNPIGALKTGAKGLNHIFDLIDQLFNLNRIGDTITADGTEQTIFIIDNPDFCFEPTYLHIDCTNMQAGDTLVIRVYYRIKSGGDFIKQTETTLNDDQDPDLSSTELEPNLFGIKITIEQTAGTNRDYDYEVFFNEK